MTVLLAAPTGEAAKSGPWGLAVVLVLCVACYFLFKSMSRHMRRVREDFPAQQPPPASQPVAPEPAGADVPADVPRAELKPVSPPEPPGSDSQSDSQSVP